MSKERTPEKIYDDLVTKGLYEEAHFDKDEVANVKRMALEDYAFGKVLRNMETPNWRVIFNIHYDVLRELCDQLMRFKKQKTSNHQGVFAFIILNFPELDLGWPFFEIIRNIRNQNKYRGTNITKKIWKQVEFQIDLYISTLKTELEEKLEKTDE